MLPESAIAEESMLQAALAASLEELRDRGARAEEDQSTSVDGEHDPVPDQAPEGEHRDTLHTLEQVLLVDAPGVVSISFLIHLASMLVGLECSQSL